VTAHPLLTTPTDACLPSPLLGIFNQLHVTHPVLAMHHLVITTRMPHPLPCWCPPPCCYHHVTCLIPTHAEHHQPVPHHTPWLCWLPLPLPPGRTWTLCRLMTMKPHPGRQQHHPASCCCAASQQCTTNANTMCCHPCLCAQTPAHGWHALAVYIALNKVCRIAVGLVVCSVHVCHPVPWV
jgi:hypothetical protein